MKRQFKQTITFLNVRVVRIILSWAAYYWYPSITNSKTIIDNWLDQLQSWEKKSGAIWTIARVKDLKLIYTRYISGEPFKVYPGRIGLLSSGLPKCTPDFNTLIQEGSNESVSFLLTLLSVSRAMSGTKDPDLSTITDDSKAEPSVIEELGSYIPTFFYKFDIPVGEELKWTKEDMRLSEKAGPTGPATLTAWRDAYKLSEGLLENIKELSPGLYEYLNTLKSRSDAQKVVNAHAYLRSKFDYKKYTYYVDGDKTQMRYYPHETRHAMFLSENPDNGLIRKLSIINDPEAKARIIAILDFWSQETLRPLHDLQFKILAKIPKDRTFTQDPVINDKEESHSYHSLDLSAATDRFPIEIQEKLNAWLMNPKKAAAWKSILIDTPFAVPWEKDKVVKYSTGQPMGAYSSWSTFTLSHHLVVNYAAHLAGYPNFDKYILLGDDIVIYDDDVAREYKTLMARLGVGISPHKTHTSKTMYEFAKRWFRDGTEITGIQVRGFVNSYNSYPMLYAQIKELYEKGRIPRIITGIPHLLLNLLRRLGNHNRMRINLLTKVRRLNALTRYIREANPDYIVQEMKMMYRDSDFVLPQGEELSLFINNYLYDAASSVIQKASANALSFNTGLRPRMINEMSAALADAYSPYPPQYQILMSPITQAFRNRLKILAESLSNMERGSIKDMMTAISMPSPSVFGEEDKVARNSMIANMANKLFAGFENHIKERPLMYQANLSSTVMWNKYTEINQLLLNHHLHVYDGYGYQNPPMKAVTPKSDPYGNNFQGY